MKFSYLRLRYFLPLLREEIKNACDSIDNNFRITWAAEECERCYHLLFMREHLIILTIALRSLGLIWSFIQLHALNMCLLSAIAHTPESLIVCSTSDFYVVNYLRIKIKKDSSLSRALFLYLLNRFACSRALCLLAGESVLWWASSFFYWYLFPLGSLCVVDVAVMIITLIDFS